ncbi:MAG: hypothetical protein ABI581_02785 [Sediminibacterium sp.]
MHIYKRPIIYALITMATLFAACDKPDCKNENTVFDKYQVGSKEHTNELIKLLNANDAKNISFWFDHYEKEKGNEYMIVNMVGNNLCSQGKILVKDWSQLGKIQKNKGGGYRGAELVGLTISYIQDSTTSQLVYKDIDYIVD